MQLTEFNPPLDALELDRVTMELGKINSGNGATD